jgi:hypothetical protein
VLIYLLQQQLKHASAHLPAATTIKTRQCSSALLSLIFIIYHLTLEALISSA